LGREALALVSPATPYVCIGFHQDAEQEVDLAYCTANGIPVFRREVGGGAVYLDGHQLFFQLILRGDHPLVTKRKETFYQKFLQPVINVYQNIGIPTEFKPINDLLCGTRKISGTGAGEIGECIVFVGNLILDFDYETMSKVLRVPDEKFRDKVHKTLRENLTTIRRELGVAVARTWDEDTLNAMMAEEFQKLVGPMEPGERDQELQDKIQELREKMLSDPWLHQKWAVRPGRDVKIRSGIRVAHRAHKAPGGLIRADFEVVEGTFRQVVLSGDFFCFPEGGIGWLEKRLEGEPVEVLPDVVASLYAEKGIETPGVTVDDWVAVLGTRS
jgi:lipoate-protein ligase A